MVSAQNRPDRQHHRKFSDRFEELEKLKLLEILDLDEETAIKFFSRRNEMKKKITSIMDESEEINFRLIEIIENDGNKNEYENLIDQWFVLEEKLLNERLKFLKSLNNILSQEQIAKVIIFERKFKKDVRDLLIEKGRRRFFKEKN
jgi:hypothetical protein